MDIIIQDIAISILLLELGCRLYQKYALYLKCWWSIKSEPVKEYSDNTLNEELKEKYDDL